MFDADKLFAPLIVLCNGSLFAALARRGRPLLSPHFLVANSLNRTEASLSTTKGSLYALSAALLAATLPYAQLLLHPLNNKLEAKAAEYARSSIADGDLEANVRREETVHYLVDQWAIVNLGRSAILTLAAVLATWASRCRT